MSNHGYRGVLSFWIQISPLYSECPVPCPPQVNSYHMPCASLHVAALRNVLSSASSSSSLSSSLLLHHHHYHPHPHPHHHHSTCNSDFSTSICPVPNGAMKVTGSSIHRYRKRYSGVCANTDRVFFPPHDVWVRQYIPPNGYLKWTKWWAIMDIVGCSLFGSRYFRSEYPVPCPPPMSSARLSHWVIPRVPCDTTTFRVTPSQVEFLCGNFH